MSFISILPRPAFIAQRIVGPIKQLKQIIQTEHNELEHTNCYFKPGEHKSWGKPITVFHD